MNHVLAEKYLPPDQKARILVAPLDWGLGHATRCIPIIQELIKLDCEVWLAGEGAQQELLKQEFPDLHFLPLEGYRVKYAKSKTGLWLSILRQTNKIYRAIKKENAWLKETVKKYGFSAVISDNRYGLYHRSIPCIFITHQLRIKSPFGKWTERLLQRKNYRYINRFTECWVPDHEEENNLAGELSHPFQKPAIPLRYIGPLSRLEKKEWPEKEEQLLVILSGPEPQRSLFEDKIINEISHYQGTATVLRGLPHSESIIPSSNMLRFYNHLSATDLNREMLEARYIISRCGYSTIMDLAKLQKKSILIPTPGQTEQEWLADYLSKKQFALCVTQKDFFLNTALENAANYPYQFTSPDAEPLFKNVLGQFVSTLRLRLRE